MNRTVLITGASSGIGAATALALADRCRLALVARSRSGLEAIAGQVRAAGGSAVVVAGDLREPSTATSAVAAAVQAFGGLDAVVNNAGVYATAPAATGDDAHWHDLFSLNVFAAQRVVRAALPHLRASRGGWIVNVSSVAAEQVFPGCGAYAASKAALEQWSRALREELRGDRIRVGVVVPGATDTEALRAVLGAQGDGRCCRASDVAGAIRFLLEQPLTASIDRLVITPPAGAI